MSRVRFTVYFRGNDSGWSESIHLPNDASDVTGIRAKTDQYLVFRRAFLNSQYAVISTRVSDDETFRDIVVPRGPMPQAGEVVNNSLAGYAAVLLRMQSGNRVFRNMFLRGLTAVAVNGRNLVPDSGTAVNIGAFANFLSTGGFSIAAKSPTVLPTLELDFDPLTGLHTVQDDIAGLGQGVFLSLTKAKRSLVPQRLWQVATAPTLKTFTLVGWPNTTTVKLVGRWRNATPQLFTIGAIRVGAVTERRVGRPFDLPRGRAPVVR